MSAPEEPRKFAGYLLCRALGRGGYGEVFLARPTLERPGVPPLVAIKRVRLDADHTVEAQARFAHEAKVALNLASPRVPPVYEVGEAEGLAYFVMGYVQGVSLSVSVKAMKGAGVVPPRLPVELCASIGADILEGLEALHRAADPETGEEIGFVHRDMAPKNVMIDESGRGFVIDLGIGTSYWCDRITRTGAVVGSLSYMAPEQVRGRPVDARSDLYAAGLILFEILTGERYNPGRDRGEIRRYAAAPVARVPRDLRREVLPALDAVIACALSVDPEGRFTSAAEMRAALLAAAPEATKADLRGQIPAPVKDQIDLEATLDGFDLAIPLDDATDSTDGERLRTVYRRELSVPAVPTAPGDPLPPGPLVKIRHPNRWTGATATAAVGLGLGAAISWVAIERRDTELPATVETSVAGARPRARAAPARPGAVATPEPESWPEAAEVLVPERASRAPNPPSRVPPRTVPAPRRESDPLRDYSARLRRGDWDTHILKGIAAEAVRFKDGLSEDDRRRAAPIVDRIVLLCDLPRYSMDASALADSVEELRSLGGSGSTR